MAWSRSPQRLDRRSDRHTATGPTRERVVLGWAVEVRQEVADAPDEPSARKSLERNALAE